MGDHAAHPHGVDADAGRAGAAAGAGQRPRRASGPAAQRSDAAAIRSAVASAVPDGASALASWCSSMISAVSKNGAAISAKRIISTAEIEKLAATTQFGPPSPNSSANAGEVVVGQARSCRRRRGCRASPATARCAAPPAATVKSTTTSAPASANARGSPAIVRPSIDGPAAPRVDGGDELEVGIEGHRLAHRRAHPPAGPADTDPHRFCPCGSAGSSALCRTELRRGIQRS